MRRTAAIVIGTFFLVTQVYAQTRPRATNYMIPTDVQAVGGGEAAKSTKYLLDDTIGEANIGDSRSNTYELNAGYRQTAQNVYITANCTDTVTLPGISLTGQATGSGSCVVTTDNEAGYALSWRSGSDARDGLAGHWRLDETTGTTAYDESGFQNDGAHQNAPTISTSVPSHYFSTRSLDFNGTDEYVSIADDPAFLLDEAITLSAWVKTDDTGSIQTIIHKPEVWFLQLKQGASLCAGGATFCIGADLLRSGGGYITPKGSTQLSASTWYHVALTYDGARAALYLNGKLDGTAVSSATLATSSSNLIFGNENGTRDFDGNIDDIRIYNRALGIESIQQLASKSPAGALVQSGSQVTNLLPFSFPATGGLLGYWKMDEIPAGTVADSSGNGRDGTPTGASGTNNTPQPSTTVPNPANFRDARALDFDGTDDYVAISDTFDPTAYTISAWVRPETIQAQDIFVRTDSSGPTTNFSHQLRMNSSGQFEHYAYDGAAQSVVGTTVATAGQWYHVVGTAQNGGALRLYVNGVEEGTPDAVGTLWTGGDRYRIGSNSSGFAYFDGKIDETRLYSRALTAAEILALYGTPQAWSVGSTTTAFGGRLRSISTDTDSKWGTDNSSEKWLHIGDGNFTIVSRATRTAVSGSTEIFQFRGEIGNSKVQPPGLYVGTVEITASTL